MQALSGMGTLCTHWPNFVLKGMKMALIDEIKQILGDVLQLGQKGDAMNESTLLLGSMPEFDSMAVVSVITAIEENYGFAVDDDEIDAEVFESVGSLTRFVERKLG